MRTINKLLIPALCGLTFLGCSNKPKPLKPELLDKFVEVVGAGEEKETSLQIDGRPLIAHSKIVDYHSFR